MPPLLTFFLLPILFSAVLFILHNVSSAKLKPLAFIMSLLPLVLLIKDGNGFLYEHVDYNWLPTLSIHFHLRVDSISLIFLYLVNIIIPISILAGQSFGLILLLQGLLIGFFTAHDLVLFAFFFESILIPLYLLVSLWGGPEKTRASFTFIIYMIAGSSLMVAAILALYFSAGSFDTTILSATSETLPYAWLIAATFLLAFAVKTPLFPFHAWLPDTYCQAPTAGSILLAALLSKAGIYGIIRILFGLFPTIMQAWSFPLIALAITGVLYGALCAWAQTDFKRLIAYSSFSHVNFILAGLFIWNEMAQGGAILQAMNHAVTITGLFLVSGWLEIRLGRTSMEGISGLATYLPKLCWLTLFFILSAIALPGLNTFVSEALLLYGVFKQNFWLAATLGLTVIFSVLYMLRLLHCIYFNAPSPFHNTWHDIHTKEMLIALPLIVLVLWLGIYPAHALDLVWPAAENITKEIAS